MIISAKLEKSIRENFPSVHSVGIRNKIRERVIDGFDPITLKSSIAFSNSGIESLKAVQKVFEEETMPSMSEMIDLVYGQKTDPRTA